MQQQLDQNRANDHRFTGGTGGAGGTGGTGGTGGSQLTAAVAQKAAPLTQSASNRFACTNLTCCERNRKHGHTRITLHSSTNMQWCVSEQYELLRSSVVFFSEFFFDRRLTKCGCHLRDSLFEALEQRQSRARWWWGRSREPVPRGSSEP